MTTYSLRTKNAFSINRNHVVLLDDTIYAIECPNVGTSNLKLFKLLWESLEWKLIESKNSIGYQFKGYAPEIFKPENFLVTTYKNHIIVCTKPTNARYNIEIWMFDLEKQEWMPISNDAGANGPIEFSKATAVVYKNILVLMGGGGRLGEDHIWFFNLDSRSWFKPNIIGAVPVLQSHTASLIDSTMFVFGGYYYSDIEAAFPHANFLWSLDLEYFIFRKVEVSGMLPERRNRHISWAQDHKLYIQGGWLPTHMNNVQDLCRTTYCFDTISATWQVVKVRGDQNLALYNHSAVQCKRGLVLVGGKIHNFFGDNIAIHMLHIQPSLVQLSLAVIVENQVETEDIIDDMCVSEEITTALKNK